MWPRRRFAAALGSAWLAAPAAAQFSIEIRGIGATTRPLALAALRGEPAGPVSVSAIVRADLERSGAFRFVEAPEGQDERSAPPQAELRARGADALLSGSLTRLADGGFDIRYRLWDAIRGEPLLARAAAASAGDLRLAAHRIADEVYEKLTGERGVFSTRIAYVTRAGRQYALRITDADGESGQVAVQSAEPLISPAWSPDGRSLAYVSFETQKAGVWVQEVATGRRQLVAHFRGSNSAPAWAPSGRELAVTLSRDGVAQIYLIQADGSNLRRLTTSSAIDTEPVFTPDGLTVYFVSDRGGGPQVYRTPVTGASARQLQHQPGAQPRRQRAGLRGARGQCLPRHDDGAGQRNHPHGFGHQRRRKPELRPQRAAARVCQPGPGPRCAHDDHPRWPRAHPLARQRAGHARARLGALWALNARIRRRPCKQSPFTSAAVTP